VAPQPVLNKDFYYDDYYQSQPQYPRYHPNGFLEQDVPIINPQIQSTEPSNEYSMLQVQSDAPQDLPNELDDDVIEIFRDKFNPYNPRSP